MSTLYLVATPIGNLADLSPRAGETLRAVARILCEDTRRTRILADRVGTHAPLVSLHQHNERERVDTVLGWLDAGEDLALVSDAGTPLVSDPGARLVDAVAGAGHDVIPIPGPSAVLVALVASGLPTERFTFLGFLPRKGTARAEDLTRVARSSETAILFESPHRLVALLEDLAEECGEERRVAVSRELTKLHEETVRGTLEEVAGYYRQRPPRGEVTVVVEPAAPTAASEADPAAIQGLAVSLLEEGMKPSAAARALADRLGLARNEAYRIVHDLKDSALSPRDPKGDPVTEE